MWLISIFSVSVSNCICSVGTICVTPSKKIRWTELHSSTLSLLIPSFTAKISLKSVSAWLVVGPAMTSRMLGLFLSLSSQLHEKKSHWHTQAVHLLQHSLMQSASPYSTLYSIRRQRHEPWRRTHVQHFFLVTAASCMINKVTNIQQGH